MAVEPLISLMDLKTNRLRSEKEAPNEIASIRYDDELDTLILWLVEPNEKTVVYFVDDVVGLVYEENSLEIIGVHIDYFVEDFLPAHEGVERAWRLSKSGIQIADLGDFIVATQELKPQIVIVAHEVVQAAREVVRTEAEELAAELEYAA